jgi:NADPH2:quinone reductase
MMRAVICREWGDPEGLQLAECEAPSPGPGEVVVAVEAAGVNFADTLMIAGKYQEKPPFPFTPGLEAAGRIKAIGAEVRGLTVGERVMALCDHGAFAEEMLARESEVLPIPASMDWTTAAGFPIAYGTAHGALTWHAGLQAGQTLLVHGAGGGVGLAAVEVGKAMGARVIATAGGAAKLGLAEAHGADALIDSRQEDIRQRVLALTDGRGADVVLDPVGGEVFEASLRATAWGGRILVIGFASGQMPQIPAGILLVKNIAAMGVYWGSYRRRAPEMVAAQFRELARWFEEGRLHPHVSHVLPLAEAAAALRLLSDRKAAGKVVLTCGEAL